MTPRPDSSASGVRIARLSIRNYKRIDHLEIEFPLPPMADDLDIFVLGSRNGGGKSSVLECCALLMLTGLIKRLHLLPRSALAELFPTLLGLLIKSGHSQADLYGEFAQAGVKGLPAGSQISLDIGNPGAVCSVHLHLKDDLSTEAEVVGDCFPPASVPQSRDLDEPLTSILAFSSEPLIRPPLLHFNSYRKVSEFNPELGMLADDYGSASALQFARRRALAMGRIGTPVSAFKLEVLRSLMGQASLFEGLDNQESAEILDTLNGLIERYCGGRIEKLRPLADNRFDIRIKPRDADASFSFDGLSSGQKEMIATLFLIWRNTRNQPGVVLIDEPELHLNAEWHGDFVYQLRQIAPWNQYILATHSETIFASVDESRRLILEPDGSGDDR